MIEIVIDILEDYKNLDDLVNNLFDHFKEELSKK